MLYIVFAYAFFFLREVARVQLLKEKILAQGQVLPGNVLKVDSFLNHQMDVALFAEMGREFCRLFGQDRVTKIVTIEASGIGIACLTAHAFYTEYGQNIPVVFAKKSRTSNLSKDVYSAPVQSYTHGCCYDVVISRQYLSPEDRVLLIDDFLANGYALAGLRDLVRQAGATLVGAGIVIEKGFQPGGDMLRKEGMRIESLVIIDRMDDSGITFR